MIIDSHVHLFPDKLFDAVWKWFDTFAWDVKYKLYTAACIERLKNSGIDKAVIYNYAHKPGLSEYLNTWNYDLKQSHDNLIVFGTAHPDDKDLKHVLQTALKTYNLSGIKLHSHVLGRSPDHESYFPVYEQVCEHNKVVTIHAGTGPGLAGYTVSTKEISGVDKIYGFMKRFPEMTCIVPHFGADEFDEFFDLMAEFKNLWTDNTMALAGYFAKAPRTGSIVKFQDRILYGTDFPNIPYDMMTEIRAIKALNLGKEIEDKLFYKNAQRLFPDLAKE